MTASLLIRRADIGHGLRGSIVDHQHRGMTDALAAHFPQVASDGVFETLLDGEINGGVDGLRTIAIVRRKTNGWKCPVFQWLYMGALAWALAFVTYRGGRLLGLG